MIVLGSVGWDMKESPESNLHVCGKDDTKTAIYNVEKCTERRTLVQFYLEEDHMKQTT